MGRDGKWMTRNAAGAGCKYTPPGNKAGRGELNAAECIVGNLRAVFSIGYIGYII
jgi:hypothetical protein